jgi:nickel/cobalt transporter (NicO) family protein
VRRILVLLVALAALAAPSTSPAHPLGNFTVNRFSEVALSGEALYLHYVLDLAEIPTYQERDEVRAPGFATGIARGLELRVDGRRANLRALDTKLSFRPGAGGLETLRFEAVYEADRTGSKLDFRDTNYSSRIGWKEVVVTAARGARIESSSAPSTSASDELRAYPRNLLKSPLDVVAAQVTYEPGPLPGLPPTLSTNPAPERESGGFEALISQEDLSAGVIFVSLLIAAFWGAAHALTPGHGKAIVAGYLVGSRGKPRHAVMLGAIVTATHTIGVFALGLVTLLLSQFIVPERLYPWLTVASGLLVVAVGASVFWSRLKRRHSSLAHQHDHHHGHHHEHEHGHAHGCGDHGHVHEPGYDRRGLLGVGIAAGLLPCPSALVVLLSAIALHRIGLGLALILAFSLGLAATITGIGLIAVLARRAFGRLSLDGPLVRALPAVSALIILGVGVGITVNALPDVI